MMRQRLLNGSPLPMRKRFIKPIISEGDGNGYFGLVEKRLDYGPCAPTLFRRNNRQQAARCMQRVLACSPIAY
jgi:hypothetical protein